MRRPLMRSLLCTQLLIGVLIACGPMPTPLSISAETPEITESAVPTAGITLAYNRDFGLTPTFEGQVDVAGAILYLICFGAGTPTVVLDAGAGMTPHTWKEVVTHLTVPDTDGAAVPSNLAPLRLTPRCSVHYSPMHQSKVLTCL